MKRSNNSTQDFATSRVASAIESSEADQFDAEPVSFSDWLDETGHLAADHSFSLDI